MLVIARIILLICYTILMGPLRFCVTRAHSMQNNVRTMQNTVLHSMQHTV